MTPRNKWLALLLVFLLGPFGLVYCGRLRRAIGFEISLWLCAFVALACILYLPNGLFAMCIGMLILLGFKLALLIDIYLRAKATPECAFRSYQSWWGYTGIAIAFATLESVCLQGISQWCASGFHQPTQSMQNAVMRGDSIYVDKLATKFKRPQHGDVIAFISEREGNPIYCKRIIGLPGDVIEIRNEVVFRNEKKLEEPYANYAAPRLEDLPGANDYGPVTIPEGQLFVLGDNRRASLDSRFTGYVPLEALLGYVRLIYWSREYEQIEPSGSNHSKIQAKYGAIRWNRIGMRP